MIRILYESRGRELINESVNNFDVLPLKLFQKTLCHVHFSLKHDEKLFFGFFLIILDPR